MRRGMGVAAALLLGTVVLGLAPPFSGAAGGSGSSTAVTQTETVTRTKVVNGQSVVMDTRTVSLSVSQTTDLQGRQEIAVTWSGAHPTGGIVADQNSSNAQQEEYPFVLLECRGVDSTTAPAAQQLSPQTCWTQTWDEHYQESLGDPYPPYRLDQYATPADAAAIVGAPNPLPTSCQFDESAPVQHWVPFVAASGQVYAGGNAGCAGEPPESDDVGGSALPSNETFGVTGTDGTGSANFDVFTSEENQSLGCSETVPCSLVAVPIMGISCAPSATTPAADVTACEDTGAFAPGQLLPNVGGSQLAVTGSLWWSASNWRNRITVPLSFAPTSASCSLTGSGSNVVDVYGSELMIQATSQWAPSFCQGSSQTFSFVHVQTGEPEARNLVATGNAEAAFTSYAQPNGYGKPVVNAPVALTGFAISYAIDDKNGQPYTSLKLTPRLLAKLLTESYPGDLFLQQADPALATNPLNITMDPEFQALNPDVKPNTSASDEAASELVALSSDSDVMEALTTYINDDPTARAWLDGTPDQWGMVVNPAYKGIALPVESWPLLSSFEPTAWYQADENDCLYNDPVPYQPLVAAPLPRLEAISQALQFSQPNSTTICSQPVPDSAVGEKLVTNGRQPAGKRFMIGITPLADADRYLLQTAALQTGPSTFVAPDDASLQAAAAQLAPDATSGTWLNPSLASASTGGSAAYPGTMVVYAAIPTSGLPAQDAQDYASLLTFAVGAGQSPGPGVGQLPPGYLPLTSANGLAALAAYTQTAAADVAAQNGQVPPVVPAAASTTPTTTTPSATPPPSNITVAPFPSNSFSTPTFHLGGIGLHPPTTTTPTTTAAAPATKAAKPKPLPPTELPASILVGAKLWTGSSVVGEVLVLALLLALGSPAILLWGRRRGRW